MLNEWLSSGWSIVLVVLGLGLIIFLHELGHFLMAKKNGVRVEIFSLGFGPAIFKFRRGETEYRVSWLPLGGYVKMSGETLMDERKGEPWELTSKTPWQRFQIFVAGALMNLIIAFPIGIAAYVVGKYEYVNEVAKPGMAETRGGLRPGDVIVEVDGRPIESMDKFRIEMIRRATGTRVPVVVLRGGERVTLEVEARSSPFHYTEPIALSVRNVVPGSPLERAGVRKGDDIVGVDGKRVYFRRQLDEILRASPGKKVKLDVRRRDPNFKDADLQVEVELGTKTWWVTPGDDRLVKPRVGLVVKTGPAWDVLEPDDLIVQIDGKAVESWSDLKVAVEPAVNRRLAFTVEREGKTQTLEITPAYGESGKGMIGIQPRDSAVFAMVDPDSFFGRAGVQSGDEVWSAADGQSGKVTLERAKILGVRKTDAAPITFQVARGKDRTVTPIVLVPEKKEEADLAAAGFEVDPRSGVLILVESKPYRRRDFGDAMTAGFHEPWDVTIMTFDLLRKLVTGGESAKGLSGPVGIIQASYLFAEQSFGNFLWLLCLITVNLGIFNLLPIPILDGGHNLLLLIEVVRKRFGKPPPSPNFVAAFQWTGLIFVLALFVFVTFNDIHRIIGRG